MTETRLGRSPGSPRRCRHARRATAHTVLAAALAAGVAGCSVRVLSPSPADSLRETVAAQAVRIEQLERRERELAAQLREALQDGGGPAAPDAEAAAARPRLASLALGGSSCIRRGDGGSTELLLHLEPRDGRGRFLQIVGTLEVEATALALGESPRVLGRWRYGPLAVRDAWRSSFMGGHYAFREKVSLPSELAGLQEVAVLIRFEDAIDLSTHELLRGVGVVDLDGEAATDAAGASRPMMGTAAGEGAATP